MYDLIPAGEFFCSSCFCQRDFVLAEDATPEEKAPDLECFVCGFVFTKNYREVNMVTGERLPPNVATSPMIDPQLREEARAKLRDDFQKAALRSGYRRENFTGSARRGSSDG